MDARQSTTEVEKRSSEGETSKQLSMPMHLLGRHEPTDSETEE